MHNAEYRYPDCQSNIVKETIALRAIIHRNCALFTAVMLFLSVYGCKDRCVSMENTPVTYKVYRSVDVISIEHSSWDSGCWKNIRS